jgi:hypothetical protein
LQSKAAFSDENRQDIDIKEINTLTPYRKGVSAAYSGMQHCNFRDARPAIRRTRIYTGPVLDIVGPGRRAADRGIVTLS